MKKNRVPIMLIAAVFAVMLLAACGQDTPGPGPGPKPGPSGQTADLKNPYAEESAPESSTYNIVFNLNYEGAPQTVPQKVAKGSVFAEALAPRPDRDGQLFFNGWYTDRDCTKKFDFSSAVNGNLVLFAGWKSDSVTVSFNYNYVGGPEILRVTVGSGNAMTAPETPQRANYSFAGWYSDAQGSGSAFDFAQGISSNMTLYAKWTLTDAVITYDVAAEDAAAVPATSVKVGEKPAKPADPVRTAYDFAGWVRADGTPFDFDQAVTEASAASGTIALRATWTLKVFTVTFDWGDYSEGTPASVQVEYGQAVAEPAVNRTGYTVVWQLDGADYGFSNKVESDLTLKAVWSAVSSDSYTVTFAYNYPDAPANGKFKEVSVQRNRRVSVPDKPGRDGYYFLGWYADAEGTTRFSFDQYIRSNVTAYAKWLKRFVFEAEYVDFTGLTGAGYSNEVAELQLIKKDVTGTCQASNGYYVTSLFINGAHIDFHIYSDEETDDAVIFLRIQAEYVTMTMKPEWFGIRVNGELVDYPEITIEANTNDVQTNNRRPFFEYELTGKVHLKKGENVIHVETTNTQDFDAMGMHFGTLSSYAPMLDCLYVYSDTELTWEPKLDNIPKWEAANQ